MTAFLRPIHRHTPAFRARMLIMLVASLPILLGLAGCDNPQTLGDANSIIVGIPDAEWAEVEEEVYAALEPRTFTVRSERIFEVTQADPTLPQWGDLRRFQQVLLIGEPGDPWIAQALDEAGASPTSLPAVVHARDVWARDQYVTIAVTPPAAGPTAIVPLLDEIGADYLRRFQQYTRARMFVSGVDSMLADSLRREAGFSVLLPEVYNGGEIAPNVYHFRNAYPDPSELIRSVLVTWRPADADPPTAEEALAWRAQVGNQYYEPPQIRDSARVLVEDVGEQGAGGVEVQGVWTNPPGGWPAAGPFITRLVSCPAQQREYLLDAWLYAPGEDKYEYMLQLETILNTFECGTARG